MTVLCRSTRYGLGCGHPVTDHVGPSGGSACCCCNWEHNAPTPCPVCGGARVVDTSPPCVEHAPWLQTDTEEDA